MDSPMEFWGVEVKVGESVKVDPNDDFEGYIHISKVALGEVKKGKTSEPVVVYVKVKDQKIVLGTLNKDEIPQISLDIVLDQESELSHNSKNAAVYFYGYKVFRPDEESEGSDSSDSDEELAPLKEHAQEVKVEADKSVKPTAEVDALTKQVKVVDPVKHEDESDDESDSDFSEDEISDDEIDTDSGESESEQDATPKALDTDTTDTDGDTDSEEETPAKKVVTQGKNNKRGIGAGSQTPVPAKKAKNATPEKTDGKKGVHIATPHPTKQGGKFNQNAAKGQTSNSSKSGQQSKKSKQGRR
ncbi:unnamed protein product [Lathyrus sativus]|nr:unnamed protein product [Lathyrus sativus]